MLVDIIIIKIIKLGFRFINWKWDLVYKVRIWFSYRTYLKFKPYGG